MARPSNVQAFVTKHKRHIDDASLHTNIPPSVIAAQWGLESGWGSSRLYHEGNSMVAIRWQPRHGQNNWVTLGSNGDFAAFASYDDAVADYIWLMHRDALSTGQPTGYKEVRAAGAALYPGTSNRDATLNRSIATAKALGESMYDAGKYGAFRSWPPQYPGVTLVELILAYDLVDLDPEIKIAPYVGEIGQPVDEFPGYSRWDEAKDDVAEFVGGVGEKVQGVRDAVQRGVESAASAIRGGFWVLASVLVLWGGLDLLQKVRRRPAG